ncbi:MAG: penicillin-binding protein 2 [Kiritimatiellae bacterium]|nr:penicillin-binding protein 2 [Kiritimatiellia bacterium]
MSQRSRKQKKWIIIILILVVITYTLIVVDLIRTQLGDNLKSQRYSFDPRHYSRTLYAVRGNIFDRNLENPTILATSIPQWRVFLDSSMITTNDATLYNVLTQWDELPEERIKIGLEKDSSNKYYILGKTTNREFADFLKTNSITRKCIGLESTHVRIYPQGNFLNPILGIVNSQGEPIFGFEYELNKYLCGTNGYVKGLADARKNEIRQYRTEEVAPVNGCNVFLTISAPIQEKTEALLKEAIETNNAIRGWIIVQRPYTGEILAMASYPTYTRENYGQEDQELQRNYATSWNFEPGSIMKAMIFSLGLNDNLYKTNDVFDCRPRDFFGYPLADHVNNEETFASSLAKSSNRASSIIAMTSTKERMEQYLKAYGFGQKTGIIRIGEEKGIMTSYKDWANIQHIRIAIGQGISVTPIQMIGMYSTIANGGIRYKPYLVRQIQSPTGEIILENKKEAVGRVISEETAEIMRNLLVGVTDRSIGGTGRRAKIPGYTVAGKTGTAQKVINKKYSTTDYTASFVGFFPAENPEITILVGFDSPKPLHQGGTVAAPVFAELGKFIADYLNIPKNDDRIHNPSNYIDKNK